MGASSLPLAAQRLLPHAGPMCCIDRLLAADAGSAEADVVLAPGHSLVHDGMLDPAGYIELAAQTAGAMHGYDQFVRDAPPKEGFLVGVQDFDILAPVREGDRLHITVSTLGALGDVTLLAAEMRRDETLVAKGKLKVFVPE